MKVDFSSYYDAAYRAYYWTSHTPDKRAEDFVRDYAQELEEDMQALEKKGFSGEQIAQYRQGYESRMSSYLSARSRTASSMITGPSNFPVEKNRRALATSDKKYNEWEEYKEKWRKKQIKKESELSEYEQTKQLLESAKKAQERMKEGNAIVRKYKNGKKADMIKALENANFTQELIKEMTDETNFWGLGFARFSLTNNNNYIKRLEDKIQLLERKESLKSQQKESGEAKKLLFDGGEIVINRETDRIEIRHDQKPPQSVRDELKKHAWKWSPHWGAWVRQITSSALDSAKRITGYQEKPKEDDKLKLAQARARAFKIKYLLEI